MHSISKKKKHMRLVCWQRSTNYARRVRQAMAEMPSSTTMEYAPMNNNGMLLCDNNIFELCVLSDIEVIFLLKMNVRLVSDDNGVTLSCEINLQCGNKTLALDSVSLNDGM